MSKIKFRNKVDKEVEWQKHFKMSIHYKKLLLKEGVKKYQIYTILTMYFKAVIDDIRSGKEVSLGVCGKIYLKKTVNERGILEEIIWIDRPNKKLAMVTSQYQLKQIRSGN